MGTDTIPFELDVQRFMRLLIAAVLGVFVGFERELAGEPADVRTPGMVHLRAVLFAVVSLHGSPRRSCLASAFSAQALSCTSAVTFMVLQSLPACRSRRLAVSLSVWE